MPRPHKHMVPRPIQASYKVGEVINIHVLLTTNHLGRFQFRVCPRNATRETHCTTLERYAWHWPSASGTGAAVAAASALPLIFTCPSVSAWLVSAYTSQCAASKHAWHAVHPKHT
jgi:hypothetical protein